MFTLKCQDRLKSIEGKCRIRLEYTNACILWKSATLQKLFVNPFPMTILDSSKLKGFASNNFKLDENGRKFSKMVENNVRKGEIARYE